MPNWNRIATGLAVVGGGLGIVVSIRELQNVNDQIHNGVKLRDDQMKSIIEQVSTNVSNNIVNTYPTLADEFVARFQQANTASSK